MAKPVGNWQPVEDGEESVNAGDVDQGHGHSHGIQRVFDLFKLKKSGGSLSRLAQVASSEGWLLFFGSVALLIATGCHIPCYSFCSSLIFVLNIAMIRRQRVKKKERKKKKTFHRPNDFFFFFFKHSPATAFLPYT
jgi:hypothetical protein